MSPASSRPATPAAGGVVWRTEGAHLLVALVHRPRYQDWTLPKGKANTGEPRLLTAVREVGEETGAQVEVGRRLTTVEYPIGDGLKRVSHWAMRYRGGEHRPNDEVDRLRWLTVAEATQLLTYPVDRCVLADFARVPVSTNAVLLLRHAKAGKRSEFTGPDELRPLDKIGRRHAREAAPVLAAFNPRRVLSANRVRCEQTVQPAASLLGLPIEQAPQFSDESYLAEPERTIESLHQLAELSGPSLICSQGLTIPGVLQDLSVPAASYPARKGSLWMLTVHQRRVVAADYYPHPNL